MTDWRNSVDGEDADLRALLVLDGGPGPARPISHARAEAMVERALNEALGVPAVAMRSAAGATAARTAGAARPMGSRNVGRYLVAATLLLAFGAAAWWIASSKRSARDRETVSTGEGTTRGIPPAVSPSTGPAVEQRVASPAAPSVEPIAPSASPSASPEVAEAAHAAPPDLAENAEPLLNGTPAEIQRRTADLLRTANELRGKRKWRAASDTYIHVVQTAPRSSAANVAMISAASIELSQLHHPDAALRLYRDALRRYPGSPLLEEARYGIAQSLRGLNRPADEARALQDFVRHHPDSAMRRTAEARLNELGAQH